MLVNNGADVMFIDDKGNTYVHKAAVLHKRHAMLAVFTNLNKINLVMLLRFVDKG